MTVAAQEPETSEQREKSRECHIMLIAHKIVLDPNNVQMTYFTRAAGTARFAYSRALGKWRRQYET